MTPGHSRSLLRVLGAILALTLLAAGCGDDDDGDAAGAGTTSDGSGDELRKLTVSAPSASLSFLPLDVAIDRGFFEEEGLDVELVTLEGPAAGHVSAVLSGEAWAFIGGVEHVLVANARGSDLRTIGTLTARSGQYLVAGEDIHDQFEADPAAALRGKRIAVSNVGQSPNFAARAYLSSIGLDPDSDVTLIETDSGARLAAVASDQADLAITSEPIVSKGQLEGVWGEPLLDLTDHRPYVQHAINLPLSVIEEEPDVVRAFLRAIVRAEQSIYEEPDEAKAVFAEHNPDLSDELIEIAFQNGIDRGQWVRDGRFVDGAVEAVTELAEALVENGEVDADSAFDLRFLPEDDG